MIVRQFLQWVRTAEAAERAEATSALARAYLYSDLSPDDRAAAEGAMILLLDDPSPLVRYALADVLGGSLPDADRKHECRHCGILGRAHRAAVRPSRGDPRVAARLVGPAGSDPPHAGRQAVRDARGLCGCARLAGRGQGATRRPGGL